MASGLIGLTKVPVPEAPAERLRGEVFEIPDLRRFRLCARLTRS